MKLTLGLAYVVLSLWGGFASPYLFAQSLSTKISIPPSEESTRQGRLLVVAFRNGSPAQSVRINGPCAGGSTDSAGVFSCRLSTGEHSLVIPELEREFKFTIVPDAETQVVVQLLTSNDHVQGNVELLTPPVKAVLDSSKKGEVKSIQVRVMQETGDKPIAGATILSADSTEPAITDGNGQAFLKVSESVSALSVFHSKYQTQTIPLSSSAEKTVSVRLKQATEELEDVVVLAPKIKGSVSALVEVRRRSSAVSDVLGSEQMARQGDSDAAASLRRITGLTLMNGKYVYVRGLGERYSGVQMNQFSLPSPEPSRRVVPLDLFPTSILESVVVQKSYTPELPGEFGGGIIRLQTRSLPEKYFFRSSLSTNYESGAQPLSYLGGSTDWLGRDDGTRAMPAAIRSALASGRKLVLKQAGTDSGISEEELTALGRSLKNNYAITRTTQQPLPNLSIATGNQLKFGAQKLGAAGSVLYGQSVQGSERLNRGLNASGRGQYAEDFRETFVNSEVETRVAGNLDVGLQWNKHQSVTFNTFLLRHTTNLTQEKVRRDPNSISQTESATLDWTERQLVTNHLKGKHRVTEIFDSPVEVMWRAGWSNAKRDSPDRREYAYERTPTSYQLRDASGGNRRTYSELTDKAQELGIDLQVPLAKSNSLSVKFGASQIIRQRRADVFRLFFQGSPTGEPIEQQLKASNIGPNGFQLRNLTDAADSYSGQQVINAQYAMLEMTPFQQWTFQMGARHESSVQSVNTFRYFEPDKPFSTSELLMSNYLPAYSAVWKPSERIRARLAYSETLARPDFRELSEVGFIDDDTGNEVRGNASLKGAVIRNLDHRWEYYFTSDEYVSLGGFYKQFENPIEVMFVPGVNRIQTFANAKAAKNYGLEIESRVGLRHSSRTLRRWTVLSNLTLIDSTIELDDKNRGVQTSASRPLQGQSPYVVNLQLQYDRPAWGLSATLLYNVIGKRITEVGTNEIPDTYEQAFHQVDFVASKTIDKNWAVALRARNLLDPEIISKQGDEVVRQTRLGRSFGISLNGVY